MTDAVECPACGSRSVRPVDQWPAGRNARAMACRSCGLLFLHQPAAAPASPEPGGAIDLAWLSTPKDTSATKKGAALALLAALDTHIPAMQPAPGTRVLSIGPGAAAWLNALRDRGWNTFGIGATGDAAGRHQMLAGVPADERFDLVIAYHVLERQARPLDALRALARATRPGGYCFLSVPRIDTLAEHRDLRSCLHPGKHTAAFTEACLRGLLARAGFDVVDVLHGLDHAFTPGRPLRLRVLAQKADGARPATDPVAALDRVLEALDGLESAPTPQDSIVPEPAACPACDGTAVHVVDEWRLPDSHARAVACGDCGLLFVHPQPSPDTLDEYYAPEGGWSASRPERSRHVSNRTEGAAGVILPALDAFFPASRPAPGARVFDFGCGDGAWLNTLQDIGWDTYGLEPSTDAAFVRHTRLVEIPSTPQFDFVLAYHVLEHLPRPLDTLRALAGALVPGGHCLVSVPRLDMLSTHRQVDYCLHPRHHIVGFTEACLRGLLARAGMEVVFSLTDLDSARSKGRPVRLQLLARKAASVAAVDSNAAAALAPVVAAFVAIKSSTRA